MAFVGGLMGPYMRPIPIGATAAMVFSLLVAFIVTPWAAVRILKPRQPARTANGKTWLTRLYRRVMGASCITRRRCAGASWLAWLCLLLGSVSLVYIEFVKVKMLPFDNKSEFQVIVDMPDGTTLEETARVTPARWPSATLEQPEVVNVQTYVGTASPYNFNGLVRHYYLRRGSNVADIQVNLLGKGDRKLQSHEIAKQVRQRLLPVAERASARGSKWRKCRPDRRCCRPWWPRSTGRRRRAGSASRARSATCGSAPTASWTSTGTWKTTSRSTACWSTRRRPRCNGISEDDIARTMRVASAGYQAGLLHVDSAKEDVPITLRLDRATRSDLDRMQNPQGAGRNGPAGAAERTGAASARRSRTRASITRT